MSLHGHGTTVCRIGDGVTFRNGSCSDSEEIRGNKKVGIFLNGRVDYSIATVERKTEQNTLKQRPATLPRAVSKHDHVIAIDSGNQKQR